MNWVNMIAGVSNTQLITRGDIVFTDTNPDLIIKWSTVNQNQSWSSPQSNFVCQEQIWDKYIQYCGGSTDDTVTHEMGHAFGLEDTYNRGGNQYDLGQDASLMHCSTQGLSNDDIQGIRSLFCAAYPNKCSTQWDDTAFCNGPNGQTLWGDFNGDGRADLLCRDVTTGALAGALADQSGRHPTLTWTTGQLGLCNTRSQNAYIADFDGDKRDDLLCHDVNTGARIISYATTDGRLGAIGFTDGSAWCPSGAGRLVTGDFNADGHSDVLCQDKNSGAISVDYADSWNGYLGSTDWSNLTWAWCPGYTSTLRSGDFNGDAHDDLLCVETTTGTMQIVFADTSGHFSLPSTTLPIMCGIGGEVLVGKLNNDNRADILCADHTVGGKNMSFADSTGAFAGWSRAWIMPWCYGVDESLDVRDVSADGVGDMLCHDKVTGAVRVWTNGTSGRNDFDFDGKPDLIWRNAATGQTSAWYMDGLTMKSGNAFSSTLNVGGSYSLAAIDDFNGDKNTDFLWLDQSGNVQIWSMSGSALPGGWVAYTTASALGSQGWALASTGDFNGDGSADIVWHDGVTGKTSISILKSATTSIQLQRNEVLPANLDNNDASGWRLVGTADFNADGKEDILWHNTSGELSVWYMNGTSYVRYDQPLAPLVPTSSGWQLMRTDDFNRDGKPDILWYHRSSGQISLWAMDGIAYLGHTETDPGYYVPESTGWVLVRH